MGQLTEIYRPIQSQLQATETLLVKELASKNGLMGELTRHIARMSGKRIRPALALLGAGLMDRKSSSRKRGSDSRFRGNDSRPVCLAASVEMIHTATLLHDDVIDGASLRRGLSTLNAKWGDTLSVLSGDYLYSKAFCLLSELNHQKVLHLMSDTAHTVCEGEVAQIQRQYDLSLSRTEYLKIIRWKTASLMGASAQAGALLGGASEPQAKRLGDFGLNFGLAFQILDDTQDLLGQEADLGKSLGTDLALGQLTLPLLYLRDSAEQETRDLLSQCFNGNGSGGSEDARERMTLLKAAAFRHRVPAYCRRVATGYLNKAKATLEPFPSSVYKSSLLALADYLPK
ncbi:MAG: polyprenyl synthetase family protein [Candidatus Omnitrophica bacterium]|nr:polyprenyl synthetase family protein [Candidatus Omnitrophota bacterium]